MPWLQLKARVAPEQAETLEELLIAEGASAITFQDAHDDPVFEPDLGTTPLWQETVLTGLYDDLNDIDAMLERVHQAWTLVIPDEPCPEIDYELLADRDWEREWMDGFAPLRMGKRLWIVPSWHEAPDPQAVNLLLDPGLAFGTGTHPTTALCLEWLDALAEKGALAGKSVLDFGCGSGILAIAALKLGAARGLGTDIDPQALVASPAPSPSSTEVRRSCPSSRKVAVTSAPKVAVRTTLARVAGHSGGSGMVTEPSSGLKVPLSVRGSASTPLSA